MGLSQLIRDHFDQITEWRSARITWSGIEDRIREMGLNPGTDSTQHLYHREFARRKSAEWVSAFTWASTNYESIESMLDLGYSWVGILVLIPLEVGVTSPPTLNMLIAEFRAIDRVRSAAGQAGQVTSSTAPPVPRPVAVKEVAEVQPPKTVPTPERVSESVPPKRVMAERVELIPNEDPFVSARELRERADVAGRLAATLNQQAQDAPEGERPAIKERVDEANRECDQAKVDFLHRFSDYKATFTKLHILSSSALACGAYVVVDAESDDTITLRGLDRPDRIEGLDEVPERIVIRENLSEEELLKIQEAYAADGMELGERTPVRRLAEALLVRGEFLRRDGWHEYVTLVKLTADNFPSPTLSGATRYDVRSKSMEIWPKLTGEEPVQDGEYERSRAIWHADPELEKRGEWT